MSDRIIRSRTDALFDTGVYAIMIVLSAIFLYPVIYAISSSFSGAEALLHQEVWLWPVDVTLRSYQLVFEHEYVLPSYGNTILYTVLGTAYSVLLTILGAYPLSRSYLPFRDFFMLIIAFTMLFGGGLIPTYLVVNKLGLLNTRWAMIIPGACSVYIVLITRTYFMNSIPDALQEAATLDGANSYQYLVRIVLPLSKPILAVIGLYYAVGHWNDFYTALLYITNEELLPLQSFLRDTLMSNKMTMSTSSFQGMDAATAEAHMQLAQTLKYSIIIVSTVPVLCVYPFIQKYFVKGVMIGAIKG